MKKIISIAALVAVSIAAGAQEWQDAYMFAENNYAGTARSAALGNAMTALGGDPGSLTFNPAGSAVSSYSQFMITPGISISSSYATGTVTAGDTDPIGYGDGVSSTYTRMKMPNLGYIVNIDTGRRKSGIKRYSLGFVLNTTNDFTSQMNAAGVNSQNCFGGSLASYADGFSTDVMANEAWDYSGDATRMPRWMDMVAYRSGMISGVTGADGAYISLPEVMDSDGNFRLAAPVYQEYGRQTKGYKQDMIMNLSANLSDKFFFGVSMGITNLAYGIVEYWEERPQDATQFPLISYSDGTTAEFQGMVMKRSLEMSGTGIYGKAGVIWIPITGLRLGAAIQTPTVINVSETYGYSGQVSLSGLSRSPVSSPEDQWDYEMVQPFRFNVGVAYALGSRALVSVDYERVNYAQCSFRSAYDEVYDSFSYQNQDISDILGASNIIRAGLEFKPLPAIAVRAGYCYTGSGIKDGSEAAKTTLSAGFGYSSSGSFYTDFAVRLRTMPQEYIIPYYYVYAPDASQFYNKYIDDGILTPEISVKSTLVDAMVTLGWRF